MSHFIIVHSNPQPKKYICMALYKFRKIKEFTSRAYGFPFSTAELLSTPQTRLHASPNTDLAREYTMYS